MARRSGLGKGLGALIPTEARRPVDGAPGGADDQHQAQPSRSPGPDFDEEAMSSLASSIREVGVLQPILVAADRASADEYELIAGERRWRAARRAGLQTMPGPGPDRVRGPQPRAGAGREPPPRGPEPARGGGGLPAARSRSSATPTSRSRPGSARAGPRSPTPSGCSSSRRRAAGSWPTVPSRPATPGRCSGRPTAASRRSWPSASWPKASRSGRSRRWSGDHARADPGCRRPRTRGTTARRPRSAMTADRPPATPAVAALPAPGLLELEDLLSNHLNTRVKVEMGASGGKVVDRVRHPRGPRADLQAHGRGVRQRPGSRSPTAPWFCSDIMDNEPR